MSITVSEFIKFCNNKLPHVPYVENLVSFMSSDTIIVNTTSPRYGILDVPNKNYRLIIIDTYIIMQHSDISECKYYNRKELVLIGKKFNDTIATKLFNELIDKGY